MTRKHTMRACVVGRVNSGSERRGEATQKKPRRFALSTCKCTTIYGFDDRPMQSCTASDASHRAFAATWVRPIPSRLRLHPAEACSSLTSRNCGTAHPTCRRMRDTYTRRRPLAPPHCRGRLSFHAHMSGLPPPGECSPIWRGLTVCLHNSLLNSLDFIEYGCTTSHTACILSRRIRGFGIRTECRSRELRRRPPGLQGSQHMTGAR